MNQKRYEQLVLFASVSLCLVQGMSALGAGEAFEKRKQSAINAVLRLYEKPVEQPKNARARIAARRKRGGVVGLIDTLAREESRREGRARRCTDEDLLSALLAPMLKDPSAVNRRQAATDILYTFDLGVANKYKQKIEEAAKKHHDEMVLALYALLPSSDKVKAKKWIREKVGDRQIGGSVGFFVLCALANLGDAEAENKLMARMTSADDSSGAGHKQYPLAWALGNIRSERVRRFLARGLRNEGIFDSGGATTPRRNVYAMALCISFCDDPDFPYRSAEAMMTVSDGKLDKLEAFCAKRFGIKYPSTPRKKIRSRIAR